MIRAICILVGAVASGSALAGIYLGAITLFGVGLAVAVAAGLGADLHQFTERNTTHVRQRL
ncbi:hypothetical protein [Mycobacterium aquaticum]|uniref:Uncharacterized protein n=1 Tax=Mycobacterium aquaticum TaxID=1927124 RepID=A0A1X0A0K4_9MYCO|nr:hypothetical protein [Mycobacterium aquaticum]ORA23425.1 hypothetical protein BST13_35325 [Mycobacterium aquaticum]